MKTGFLKRPKPRNWKNVHASGRKTSKLRVTRFDRMRGDVPPNKAAGDYLFANCVVLAAAVFGPSAQRWAEDMLPAARQLDARGVR